jgi:hypothetical protein
MAGSSQRSAAAAEQTPFGQNATLRISAATWEGVTHQSLPCTTTTATARRGSSAGAAPMNHS